jgi:peptidoglycan hydrolase CwlO-like protein
MAAKKQSLSDLLQEEAQKFTPLEGESAIEVTAEKIAEEEASSDQESSAQTLDPISSKRTSPTKADLEATVKELTSNLETSQTKESSLTQEISDLQSKLSKQKTFVSEQKSLLEQLTKELDDTKKTALQLAEANSQLIEEINALKQTAEDKSKLAVAVKETSAIKPVKEHYNPLNYKKSHRSSETLAQNQPQNQPNDYPDSSNEMWLLD